MGTALDAARAALAAARDKVTECEAEVARLAGAGIPQMTPDGLRDFWRTALEDIARGDTGYTPAQIALGALGAEATLSAEDVTWAKRKAREVSL